MIRFYTYQRANNYGKVVKGMLLQNPVSLEKQIGRTNPTKSS